MLYCCLLLFGMNTMLLSATHDVTNQRNGAQNGISRARVTDSLGILLSLPNYLTALQERLSQLT